MELTATKAICDYFTTDSYIATCDLPEDSARHCRNQSLEFCVHGMHGCWNTQLAQLFKHETGLHGAGLGFSTLLWRGCARGALLASLWNQDLSPTEKTYCQHFSRMRSEGFLFIIWGSGGWTLVRLQLLVARRVVVASSSRRRRVVNSVSMGEAAKPLLFEGHQAGCHVVLRGRRGTLSHSNLSDTMSKCQKWRKSRTKCSFCCVHVSRLKSLVFLRRRRVYGGSCKTVFRLEFLLFLWRRHVYGRSCKPRSFCCTHVAVSMGEAAKPQSLLFLWRRRVYGEAQTL